LYNLLNIMTRIKSVISDLGRVLVDFDNWRFLHRMERHSPLSAEDMMSRFRDNISVLRQFDMGKISPDGFYRRAVSLLEASVGKDSFFQYYNDVFSLNPYVLAVLKRLMGRYRLIMLSNTDRERYGFVTSKFPEILFFDSYILSYEVGAVKPDLKIYRKAMEAARAEAEECVFIDDLEDNIKAAKNLGIQTVLLKADTDIAARLQDIGLLI
jgi:epoxide hydrolase-like predicted phosphatase